MMRLLKVILIEAEMRTFLVLRIVQMREKLRTERNFHRYLKISQKPLKTFHRKSTSSERDKDRARKSIERKITTKDYLSTLEPHCVVLIAIKVQELFVALITH